VETTTPDVDTTTPDVETTTSDVETTTPDVETTTSDVETDPAPAPDATEAAADELTTQSMDELATHDNDVAAEPLDSAPDADVDVDVDEPEPAPEPAPAPLVEPVPTPVPEPAPVPADDPMPALVREPAMLPDGFGAKLEEIGDIEHGVRFIEKCGVPKDIVDYLGKDASKMDTLGDWMANHTEYHDFDASTELKEMERAWKATGKCHEEDDHVSDDDHDDHHHHDDDDHDDDDHDHDDDDDEPTDPRAFTKLHFPGLTDEEADCAKFLEIDGHTAVKCEDDMTACTSAACTRFFARLKNHGGGDEAPAAETPTPAPPAPVEAPADANATTLSAADVARATGVELKRDEAQDIAAADAAQKAYEAADAALISSKENVAPARQRAKKIIMEAKANATKIVHAAQTELDAAKAAESHAATAAKAAEEAVAAAFTHASKWHEQAAVPKDANLGDDDHDHDHDHDQDDGDAAPGIEAIHAMMNHGPGATTGGDGTTPDFHFMADRVKAAKEAQEKHQAAVAATTAARAKLAAALAEAEKIMSAATKEATRVVDAALAAVRAAKSAEIQSAADDKRALEAAAMALQHTANDVHVEAMQMSNSSGPPELCRDVGELPPGFGKVLEKHGGVKDGDALVANCGVPKDIVDYLGKDASKMDTLEDWMANHTEYHDFDVSTELLAMEATYAATGHCFDAHDVAPEPANATATAPANATAPEEEKKEEEKGVVGGIKKLFHLG